MRRSHLALIAVGLLAFASGCVKVAPYERGMLAHPTMTAEEISIGLDSHVRAVFEGAAGGLGGGGELLGFVQAALPPVDLRLQLVHALAGVDQPIPERPGITMLVSKLGQLLLRLQALGALGEGTLLGGAPGGVALRKRDASQLQLMGQPLKPRSAGRPLPLGLRGPLPGTSKRQLGAP